MNVRENIKAKETGRYEKAMKFLENEQSQELNIAQHNIEQIIAAGFDPRYIGVSYEVYRDNLGIILIVNQGDMEELYFRERIKAIKTNPKVSTYFNLNGGTYICKDEGGDEDERYF